MSEKIVVWTIALSENDYDIRDYLANNVLKNLDKIKKEKRIMRPISSTVYQNWRGSCTAAATTNSMKSQNEKEFWKELEFDWKPLWKQMWHNLDDKSDSWDSIANAIKFARKFNISWFAADYSAYGKRDIREKALHISPLITVIQWTSKTWSEMIKWEIKTIIPKTPKSLWHAVVICWYDENYVYFYNSFWDYIIKDWISNFKIRRELFYEMMKVNMLNWRWFSIYDKKEIKKYTKEIELAKQIIWPAKKLYEIWDKETKEYFQKIWLSKFLEAKYGFKY